MTEDAILGAVAYATFIVALTLVCELLDLLRPRK